MNGGRLAPSDEIEFVDGIAYSQSRRCRSTSQKSLIVTDERETDLRGSEDEKLTYAEITASAEK